VPGWKLGRTAAFLGGLVVVLIATCSGIEAYGHVLEWMHMIEHLLLIMVAPVLLAIGSPLQLVAEALPPGRPRLAGVPARPVVGWLTSPPFAAAFYAVCVIGVHLTGLMDRAMADDGVHVAEELAYLLAGMLLFQLVLGRRPGPWQLSGGGPDGAARGRHPGRHDRRRGAAADRHGGRRDRLGRALAPAAGLGAVRALGHRRGRHHDVDRRDRDHGLVMLGSG
jgi:hypothetical protein